MPEAALVSLESLPGAVPGLETLQGRMLQPWLMWGTQQRQLSTTRENICSWKRGKVTNGRKAKRTKCVYGRGKEKPNTIGGIMIPPKKVSKAHWRPGQKHQVMMMSFSEGADGGKSQQCQTGAALLEEMLCSSAQAKLQLWNMQELVLQPTHTHREMLRDLGCNASRIFWIKQKERKV